MIKATDTLIYSIAGLLPKIFPHCMWEDILIIWLILLFGWGNNVKLSDFLTSNVKGIVLRCLLFSECGHGSAFQSSDHYRGETATSHVPPHLSELHSYQFTLSHALSSFSHSCSWGFVSGDVGFSARSSFSP
jgi:hypothetical protein